MAMKLVKKTAEYTIYKRGDVRYAVKDVNKKAVNGEEKTRILLAEDLIKVTLPSKPAVEEETADEAVEEEAAAEQASAEEEVAAEETSSEEAPAEEAAVEEEEK